MVVGFIFALGNRESGNQEIGKSVKASSTDTTDTTATTPAITNN